MIVRTGFGSIRTTVGVARIWSPFGQVGLLHQVDHRDAIAALEVDFANLFRFASAATDLGVWSIT
jgi:hypothetical protein